MVNWRTISPEVLICWHFCVAMLLYIAAGPAWLHSCIKHTNSVRSWIPCAVMDYLSVFNASGWKLLILCIYWVFGCSWDTLPHAWLSVHRPQIFPGINLRGSLQTFQHGKISTQPVMPKIRPAQTAQIHPAGSGTCRYCWNLLQKLLRSVRYLGGFMTPFFALTSTYITAY